MPKIFKETKIVGKIATPESLTNYLESIATDSFSEWQRRFVSPGTKWKAPIYSGPDPREEYHPSGILKQYIGIVEAKTARGKTYITCGIPGTTGINIDLSGGRSYSSQFFPDRAWIITQVLHRGWSSPQARIGPMRFPVTGTVQNPDIITNPPEGIEEQPGVTWIFITFARPQGVNPINRFHTDVFESQFTQFMGILRERMTKIPKLKYKEIKVSGR